MGYTPENNPYIPGDPYSYDLKWMVAEIKRALNLYDTLDAAFADLKNDFTDLYNYFVDNFPAEVHTQILAMINDGTMTQIISSLLVGDYMPSMFGAVCDGVADDSAAFTDCVNACIADGYRLRIPVGNKILVDSALSFTGLKYIQNDGQLIVPNGIELNSNSAQTGAVWHLGVIDGHIRVGGLKSSEISVIKCTWLELYADSDISAISSIAYNRFDLIYVNKLTFDSLNSGWINENTFIGGRIGELVIDGNYGHNNNHFYNNTFEGATITINRGTCNYIHNARFESIVSITFGMQTFGNYVDYSWASALIPFPRTFPSWWIDPSGKNFLTTSGVSPYMELRKTYNNTSANFENAYKTYPTGHKLHSDSSSYDMLVTNLIPIDKVIQISVDSDVQFFRCYLYCYDDTGTLITTRPADDPVRAASLGWSTDHYTFGSVNQKSTHMIVSRYTLYDGIDSGVAYVKLSITGNASVDIEYLEAKIYTSVLNTIQPFRPDTLKASTTPSGTDWEAGTVAYNTASGSSPVGWIFDGTSWTSFS